MLIIKKSNLIYLDDYRQSVPELGYIENVYLIVSTEELDVLQEIVMGEIDNILMNEKKTNYSLEDRLIACYNVSEEIEDAQLEMLISEQSNSHELLFHPYELSYLPAIIEDAISIYKDNAEFGTSYLEDKISFNNVVKVLKKINPRIKKEIKKNEKIIEEFMKGTDVEDRADILGNLWW